MQIHTDSYVHMHMCMYIYIEYLHLLVSNIRIFEYLHLLVYRSIDLSIFIPPFTLTRSFARERAEPINVHYVRIHRHTLALTHTNVYYIKVCTQMQIESSAVYRVGQLLEFFYRFPGKRSFFCRKPISQKSNIHKNCFSTIEQAQIASIMFFAIFGSGNSNIYSNPELNIVFFATLESGKIFFRNSITLPLGHLPGPTAKWR